MRRVGVDGPSIDLQLDRAGDSLDNLRAEVSGGIRSQRHYDALEAQARAIAERLLSAFRGGWRR